MRAEQKISFVSFLTLIKKEIEINLSYCTLKVRVLTFNPQFLTVEALEIIEGETNFTIGKEALIEISAIKSIKE